MLAAFLAALVFFHSSEFLLALWSTGKPDVRCASLRLASHCSRYVPNTMFPFPRLNSAFLLALWSTGKPHARSLPPPIFVSQEELPFTTLQCLSPPPYIPPLSSLIFFFSPHHPPAQPHPAPFPFPRPAPFCGSWRSCGGTPAGGAAASAGDLFKVRFPPPTPPPIPSLSTTSSAACGPWPFLFSREYLLAMAATLTEYALETTLFPAFKRRLWPVAWVRHPGYTGWFMWSIATQLLLVNPLCTLAFALVSWRFFAARIPHPVSYPVRSVGLEQDLQDRESASTPSASLCRGRCEAVVSRLPCFLLPLSLFLIARALPPPCPNLSTTSRLPPACCTPVPHTHAIAIPPHLMLHTFCFRAPPSPPLPPPLSPASPPLCCSYEDLYLHPFFGLEYAQYAASLLSCVPFVSSRHPLCSPLPLILATSSFICTSSSSMRNASAPMSPLSPPPFFKSSYEEFYLHQFFGLDYYEFYLHQVFCLRCEEFYMHQVFGHDYEEFYLHQFLSLKNARYAASVPRCLGAWVSYRASPNGLPSPHPCSYEEFYLHQFFGLEYA
ncbi:unnamed protein product [Closterium sp. NIES-65]|nr:unnamed protein product [Closterium sp. NIES-65]